MDTRQRILDVAQELVQTLGANAMSYQHISEAIGIRKASIHHHFPTKENLLESLIERYSARFLESVDRIGASPRSGAAKVREYIRLFASTLDESAQEKACAMGMLGAEVRTLGDVAAERVRQFYLQNERSLAQMIETGKRDGSLQFKGSPEALAGMIFALLEGGMLVSRGRGEPAHFREITGQVMKLIKSNESF